MSHTILTISLRELKNSLNNHYLLGMTLLLASLSFALILLGDTPFGSASASPLSMQITSLSSLSIFFIPLMALFISHDAIVGEREQGSLLLILSYPIKRYQFILGKFYSHWLSLSISITFGYGLIFILILLNETNIPTGLISSYLTLISSSILLGGVFTAIGYLISTLVGKRSTSIIYCIAIWLFFIIFFDMFLLIALVGESGSSVNTDTLNNILLFNPIDVFRILSIGSQNDNLLPLQALSNTSTLSSSILLLAFSLWMVIPLWAAIFLFEEEVL